LACFESKCLGGKCIPQKRENCTTCDDDSGCKTKQKCVDPSCVNGECVFEQKEDCCGNGICEEDSGENICSCKEDCGDNCTGEVQFITDRGFPQKAKYFEYACARGECQINYEVAEIDPRQAYHDVRSTNLVFGLQLDYIQPFEINHGKMQIELQLKDVETDLIQLPVEVTDIRVLEGTMLLGRIPRLSKKFNKIGDVLEFELPLSYSMKLPEEQKTIMVTVDYQYMGLVKIMKMVEGQVVRDEYGRPEYYYVEDGIKAQTFSQVIKEAVVFIDADYDKQKVDFSED
jgi:hypothetical protein